MKACAPPDVRRVLLLTTKFDSLMWTAPEDLGWREPGRLVRSHTITTLVSSHGAVVALVQS